MSLKGPKKYNMANPVRMRRRAARRQARKYRKMSQEQRLQRVEAAKARRAQNQKSTSGVSYKVSTPVDKAAKVKAVKADIQKKKSISKQNERIMANRKAAAAAKPGETYIRIMKDGTKKKVRAVKKAEKGASLKPVPKENKGLSKLPTDVRNKMGYAQKGGVVKGGVDPKRAKELMDVMKKSSMQVRNVGELPFDSDPSNPAGLLNYVNSKLSNKIQAGNAAEINFVKKYRESMLKSEGRTDSPKMKHGGKIKAMYGAKMKKAMYGAKVKKKM